MAGVWSTQVAPSHSYVSAVGSLPNPGPSTRCPPKTTIRPRAVSVAIAWLLRGVGAAAGVSGIQF